MTRAAAAIMRSLTEQPPVRPERTYQRRLRVPSERDLRPWRSLANRLTAARLADPALAVVAVTGVGRGDGATTVARSLACVMADLAGPVLLIDAAGQHAATLSGWLGAAGGLGFGDLVNGSADPLAVVQSPPPGAGGTVDFVACGGPAAIAWQHARHLPAVIDRYRERYEWVLLDLPPVRDDAAAASLVQCCDGMVLVANAATTSLAEIADAQRMAGRLPRFAGVVLNRQTSHVPWLSRWLWPLDAPR